MPRGKNTDSKAKSSKEEEAKKIEISDDEKSVMSEKIVDSDSDSDSDSDQEIEVSETKKTVSKAKKTVAKADKKASVTSDKKSDDDDKESVKEEVSKVEASFNELNEKLNSFKEFTESLQKVTEELNNSIKAFKNMEKDMKKMFREVQVNVEKELKKSTKRKSKSASDRKPGGCVTKPNPVPSKIIKYLGLDEDTEMTRPEVTAKLYEEFKKRNLGIGERKNKMDKDTAKLFDAKTGDEFHIHDFQGMLKKLYDADPKTKIEKDSKSEDL
jgi:hypothetical protein